MLRATDKVVLVDQEFPGLQDLGDRPQKDRKPELQELQVEVPWDLNQDEIKRLLAQRSKKYLAMAKAGFTGEPQHRRTTFST